MLARHDAGLASSLGQARGLPHDMHDGLKTFDVVVVVLYVLATMYIVYRASLHQKNTDDFFLGNRRMPWMAVGLSIMATLLSSLTYLGLTGEIVKNGIAAFMTQAAILPAAPLVLFLFIPFFMRLRFTSAYEYLEHRFDFRTRLIGGMLFFLLRLGWVSLVMYSGSLALATMAGWNLYATIALLGIAATLYTFYGGLEGVVWTDVIQALMLFGGAAAIVVSVWLDTGDGPLVWWQVAGEHSAAHKQVDWFSLDPTKRMTLGTALLSGFFWQICTHCSDQVVLQRYASTPSLAAAQKSYLTNMLALLSITSLLGISGLALLHFYLRHQDQLPPGLSPTSVGDKLMLHFFATQLPLGFSGLIFANFLCDAMQTLVSGVNSITAVATQDVLDHSRLAQKSAGANRLALARGVTLLLGGLTTGIALVVAWFAEASGRNIFDLMPKTFNMFIGPLGALFLIGMFLPRATARSAVPAVAGAMLVSIVWNYWKEILSVPFVWQFARRVFTTPFDLSIMWAYGVACVSGVVFAAVLSLTVDSGDDHPGRAYTWWSVMRRPLPSRPTDEP
jgi:SSS family solute:Na+ symporter